MGENVKYHLETLALHAGKAEVAAMQD